MDKEKAYQIIDNIVNKTKYYTNVVIDCTVEEIVRFANSSVQYNFKKEEVNVNIRMYGDNRTAEININKLDDFTIKNAITNLEGILESLPKMKVTIPEYNGPKELSRFNINEELYYKYNNNGRIDALKEGFDLIGDGFYGFGALILTTKSLCIGDSEGIKRYSTYNYIDLNSTVMNEDGAAGHNRHIGRNTKYDLSKSFEISYEKAKKMVNPTKMEPGKYTVILEPIAASAMLGMVSELAFNAKAINQGGSYLSDKLNFKVIDERLNITDDINYHDMIGFGIDYEGNEKQRINIIENGVFKEPACDNASARYQNCNSNGHAGKIQGSGGYATNLIMSCGNKNLQQIIEETENGILVTMLHYLNPVNVKRCIVTGITRNGTFLVKNGKIENGIDNMRFTQDFIESLNNIEDISLERKMAFFQGSSNFVPALKINNFKFVGRSS